MGSEKPRLSQAKLFKDVPFVERPFYLSPEEDHERLERVAVKIIALVRGIQTRERGKRGRPAQLAGIIDAQEAIPEISTLGLGEWALPRRCA